MQLDILAANVVCEFDQLTLRTTELEIAYEYNDNNGAGFGIVHFGLDSAGSAPLLEPHQAPEPVTEIPGATLVRIKELLHYFFVQEIVRSVACCEQQVLCERLVSAA